jgi:hypothetical protein
MPAQDPNPLPYGALPYYQVHYIIRSLNIEDPALFMARCVPVLGGSVRNKDVVGLRWIGGRLAELLRSDKDLSEILQPLIREQGEISIDPQKDRVRIYAKWKREDKLRFELNFFKAVERIAATIEELAKKYSLSASNGSQGIAGAN